MENLRDNTSRLDSIGWGLTGAGIGLLSAAISHPFSASFSVKSPGVESLNWVAIIVEVIFLVLGGICLVTGLITFKYSFDHNKTQKALSRIIIDDMGMHCRQLDSKEAKLVYCDKERDSDLLETATQP